MSKAQTKAFYDGKRAGVRQFAFLRNGTNCVGPYGLTLVQAIQEIDQEESLALLSDEAESAHRPSDLPGQQRMEFDP